MPTIQVKSGQQVPDKTVKIETGNYPPRAILGARYFEADQLRQMADDLEARTWETTVKDTSGGTFHIRKDCIDSLLVTAPCGASVYLDKENAKNLIKRIKEVMDIT